MTTENDNNTSEARSSAAHGSETPVVGAGEALAHLERLLINCPHAKLQYNDDPDVEDEYGMLPIGFSIRMDGCAGLWSVAGLTLIDAIRADMEASERELRRMGGTAESQNDPSSPTGSPEAAHE